MSRLTLPAPLAALRSRMRGYFGAHRSQAVIFAIIVIGIALPLFSRVPPFGQLQSINA